VEVAMICAGYACLVLVVVLGICRAIGTGRLDQLCLLGYRLLGGDR
jgi:hypothetical protein